MSQFIVELLVHSSRISVWIYSGGLAIVEASRLAVTVNLLATSFQPLNGTARCWAEMVLDYILTYCSKNIYGVWPLSPYNKTYECIILASL